MHARTLLFWAAASCLVAASATDAATLQILRRPLGSGLQNAPGTERAEPVGDYGVWHAPQYLPGYPTAATLWPRVISIHCDGSRCEGYEITPELGRGEYLFFRPIDFPTPEHGR